MRSFVLAVALVASGLVMACGHHDSGGESAKPGSGSAEADREQARFDSERKPEKVVEALAIGPGSRVADIGAGTGLLTVHLARAVAPSGKVVATEVDGTALDLLSQRMERAGLGQVVEKRVVSADHPGLEAGAYDAILLAEVDNLMTDPAGWLTEAKSALKPNGRIVISNRTYHRANAMAAAKKAGLSPVAETAPTPTNFIAVFTAGDGK